MNSIKLKSRAKINLSIDVTGKREDGYHLVDMIMQTIDLYDIISITNIHKEDKIIIRSSSKEIPVNSNNIVYKAAVLIKETFKIDTGVEIFIDKNIPVAAGMAGGSSNAAAVLVGLNRLWNLKLTKDELREIGLKLGADVPFCIEGGSYRASGIGEELTKIVGLQENINILVCKPNIFVSTKDIYQGLDISNIKKRPDNEYIINELSKLNAINVAKEMYNVLEEVTIKTHTEILEIEKIMLKNNAEGSIMSGSGPTVFGLYINKSDANTCKKELKEIYNQVYVVKSSNKGVEIVGEFE